MTPAEIFKELIKPNGRPERLLRQYEALGFVMGNPVNAYIRPRILPGQTGVDRWGVTLIFPEGAPGTTPHITEETKVCKDITRWRDYCHAPDLLSNCSEGWDDARASVEKIRKEGKLATVLMGTGIFEQLHFLMGFEDTLTNIYEHPAEMHELIYYILEYRMTFLKLVIDKLHPDVILSHDDWGAKNALFMPPDLWRTYFKEPYRKFYGYMADRGVIAIHHADSYLAPIVEDMVEIGIRVWQGVLPENNIPALQEQLAGRMVLMGGIGAAIDRADTEEDEVVSYMRDMLQENGARGHFIPCITYGIPGTVFKHVNPICDREIDLYNTEVHLKTIRPTAPVRRNLNVASVDTVQETAVQTENQDILVKIANALMRGQKNRVLSLTEDALKEGRSAKDILNQGLIQGMSTLGDAFTKGTAFVPEMLMAARCMSAATEVLKPHLLSGGSETHGKVCLGTVKGDMHDIGKNLVKIMMEGSGLTVIDLGTDVSAETFVETAISEHCDIIACSSLLTTTMPEMKQVVDLSVERGIRDQVIIMVGGAPTSEEFKNEIGADIYTADAGAAARAAVEALAKRSA